MCQPNDGQWSYCQFGPLLDYWSSTPNIILYPSLRFWTRMSASHISTLWADSWLGSINLGCFREIMKLEEEEWSCFFLFAPCCFCLLLLRIIPANIFISAIWVPPCSNILICFVVSPQFTKPYCIPSETPALDNWCPLHRGLDSRPPLLSQKSWLLFISVGLYP